MFGAWPIQRSKLLYWGRWSNIQNSMSVDTGEKPGKLVVYINIFISNNTNSFVGKSIMLELVTELSYLYPNMFKERDSNGIHLISFNNFSTSVL